MQFTIKFRDGTTKTVQPHTKQQLEDALQNVEFKPKKAKKGSKS